MGEAIASPKIAMVRRHLLLISWWSVWFNCATTVTLQIISRMTAQSHLGKGLVNLLRARAGRGGRGVRGDNHAMAPKRDENRDSASCR